MASGVEIERKFLLARAPEDLDAHPSHQIEQGYLAITDGVEVRLRRSSTQAVLTIKSDGEQARVEEEIEIEQTRLASLWPLTEGRRLEKTRYLIPAPGGLTIELDVYRGQLSGLITAEIEFDSPGGAAAFQAPAWFGPEVTEDPRYKNKRLATHGLPT